MINLPLHLLQQVLSWNLNKLGNYFIFDSIFSHNRNYSFFKICVGHKVKKWKNFFVLHFYWTNCTGTGNWLLRRPQSNSKRLILDFYPFSWCGTPVVLAEEIKHVVPPILASRGITNEEWSKWMDKFVQIVQSKSWSCGAWTAGFLTCILLPICWGYSLAEQHAVKNTCKRSTKNCLSLGDCI